MRPAPVAPPAVCARLARVSDPALVEAMDQTLGESMTPHGILLAALVRGVTTDQVCEGMLQEAWDWCWPGGMTSSEDPDPATVEATAQRGAELWERRVTSEIYAAGLQRLTLGEAQVEYARRHPAPVTHAVHPTPHPFPGGVG